MTQHSAHDLCLSFLYQRKCGNEKKRIPLSCREGVERNRNLILFLQGTPANLSSLWVWPVASLPAISPLLPSSSKWERPVAIWKENCSLCQNCHVRVLNIFRHCNHRLPRQSQGRCRPTLKGKLKGCADMLRVPVVSAVSVHAKLHCFNKCLLAQGWDKGCESWIAFFDAWCFDGDTHTNWILIACPAVLSLLGFVIKSCWGWGCCHWKMTCYKLHLTGNKIHIISSGLCFCAHSWQKRSGCELIFTISDPNSNISVLFFL